MNKLYLLGPNNQYRMAILTNFENDRFKLEDLGWRSLKSTWTPLNYSLFEADDSRKSDWNRIPDICCCNTGSFVFRGDLLPTLFPQPHSQLELLPVLVEGQEWFIVNCLKDTAGYDRKKSIVSRDGSGERGQIFFIQYLIITDRTVLDSELFTLEDSNHAWIVSVQSFKMRVEKLGLKGITFKEVGLIC